MYNAGLVTIMLTLGAAMAWSPLYGRSGWWMHATVGRWIWESQGIPEHTFGLWTGTQPYIYHSWLSQLVFYGATCYSDAESLPYVVFALTACLALLPFILVLRVWRWFGPWPGWMLIPLLLAIKGVAVRFEPRPELFTGVCLAYLLMFLVKWSARPGVDRDREVRWQDWSALAGVLVLFILWANLHGAVILGFIILGVTACGDFIQDRARPRARALLMLVPLALGAICVNPYGITYFQTYLRVPSYTFARIVEWAPIWQTRSGVNEILPTVGVVTALALFAWIMNPHRRLAHLGWLLVLGLLFGRARRNVWPVVITALMVLAANAHALNYASLADVLRRLGLRTSTGESAATRLAFGALLQVGLLAWLGMQTALVIIDFKPWRPLMPTALDQGIVRCLRENELPHRMFNDYESSGYLQWALAGRPQLYLDRLDSYEDAVMRDYQDVVRMTPRGRELLDAQQIDVVVLTTNRCSRQSLVALAEYLDKHTATWVRVHADKAGVVWVRRSAEAELVANVARRWVSTEDFATLERYGEEDEVLVPPIPGGILGLPEEHTVAPFANQVGKASSNVGSSNGVD
jgi:hypothetical protein